MKTCSYVEEISFNLLNKFLHEFPGFDTYHDSKSCFSNMNVFFFFFAVR
jgi:hypothetical protein